MGMAYLDKARSFDREHNWSQALRYSDLAVTKLKQLKDRPVESISEALSYKCVVAPKPIGWIYIYIYILWAWDLPAGVINS